MREIMFDIPSREDVKECTITKEVITGEAQPLLNTDETPLLEEKGQASA